MSNYRIANWRAHNANNLDAIKDLADNSIDSIVTDPPYEIAFMGRDWDNSGQAYNEQLWRECLRVLKPGGHLIAFGATRTIHRTTSAIEASGFQIRNLISWLYFSGFPKSLNLDGDWSGFGTALKPAQEPAVLARKPIVQGTIAKQVLSTGTGALNIDGCRFGYGDECWVGPNTQKLGLGGDIVIRNSKSIFTDTSKNFLFKKSTLGRWPANIYQCAKPSRAERDAGLEHLDGDIKNVHPTVKPLKLMRWLCRLITPPSGTVLDPFAGSGTTLAAAILEGFDVIGFELTAEYMPIIEGRCKWAIEEYKRENAQLSMLDWMEASK